MTRRYIYTNDIGITRLLCINTKKDGNLEYTLWSGRGDFRGQGQMTKEEFDQFLEYYSNAYAV